MCVSVKHYEEVSESVLYLLEDVHKSAGTQQRWCDCWRQSEVLQTSRQSVAQEDCFHNTAAFQAEVGRQLLYCRPKGGRSAKKKKKKTERKESTSSTTVSESFILFLLRNLICEGTSESQFTNGKEITLQ